MLLLGWVDIGFRLKIKLGYTGTPISLKKMKFIQYLFSSGYLAIVRQKFHPSKVPQKDHRNLMCDSSKEPHRLTDYKSEEIMK